MRGEIALAERCRDAHRDERVYITEQSFAVFMMVYFHEFITYEFADFHWDMFDDLDDFQRFKVKFLLWIMFRESAKTSIAKIYAAYCIVFRKKRFINYDSYDKGNAEAALFDLVTWLQQNKRLIADFGQLFVEDPKAASRQAKMKRINEFVTANKVKVKAYSTQEATRGRIFDRFRPDLYIVDDFETETTIKSVPVTNKIISHIDGMKSGLATDGQILFLGNLITDSGSVQSLINESKENPGSWRYRRVDVVMDGKIMWPNKYTLTNEEAAKENVHRERSEIAVSIEQKKKDLNAGGRKVYEAEMLNDPEAAGDLFFDRERIDRDIAAAKKKPPVKTVGGFSIWEEFKARSRYAIGGDTAKGVQRDSCADVAIRFSDVSTDPAVVVGSYASNTIKPDEFGDEMASHGRMFGECLLAPELNNTGFATVTRLKAIYPVRRIFRRVQDEQIGMQVTKDLGWEATSANVSTIYFNFRSAYDNGEIKIYDPALLAEMRVFTRRHFEQSVKKADAPDTAGLITHHFDRLRAACIAWDMRTHAKVEGKKPYKQAPPEHPSDYHG